MNPRPFRPFYFDRKRLLSLARAHREAYVDANPFPHVVLDDFLPLEVCDALLEEFPDPKAIRWINHVHPMSKKLACNDESQMGDFTRHVLAQLNSGPFVSFLEELTGITGLVPDPWLDGGGLHQIEPGGSLGVHADYNWHPKLQLDRRINVLLYLNPGWQEEWGGHLELWGRDMTRCEKKISPVLNRCVIFNTTDFSHHGHPEPLRCPPGWTRRSIALYYFSNGRPAEEKSAVHSTLYKRRPGERLRLRVSPRVIFKRLVPPLFLDFWQFFT